MIEANNFDSSEWKLQTLVGGFHRIRETWVTEGSVNYILPSSYTSVPVISDNY